LKDVDQDHRVCNRAVPYILLTGKGKIEENPKQQPRTELVETLEIEGANGRV
jgi:hypothetical protein